MQQLLQNVSALDFQNQAASLNEFGVPLSPSTVLFISTVLLELITFNIQRVVVQSYVDSGPPAAVLMIFQIQFISTGVSSKITSDKMKSVYLAAVNSGNFTASLVKQSNLVSGNLGYCTSSQVVSMVLNPQSFPSLTPTGTSPSTFANVNSSSSGSSSLSDGIIAVIIILSVLGMFCMYYIMTDFVFVQWPATARLANKGIQSSKKMASFMSASSFMKTKSTWNTGASQRAVGSAHDHNSQFNDETATSFVDEFHSDEAILYDPKRNKLLGRPASTHFSGRLKVPDEPFDEEKPESFKKEKPVTELSAWSLGGSAPGNSRRESLRLALNEPGSKETNTISYNL